MTHKKGDTTTNNVTKTEMHITDPNHSKEVVSLNNRKIEVAKGRLVLLPQPTQAEPKQLTTGETPITHRPNYTT